MRKTTLRARTFARKPSPAPILPALPITRLRPGDIVLLQADRPLTRDAAAHLQTAWRARVGPDIKLVVLDAHWDSVHVLRVEGRRRPKLALEQGPA